MVCHHLHEGRADDRGVGELAHRPHVLGARESEPECQRPVVSRRTRSARALAESATSLRTPVTPSREMP